MVRASDFGLRICCLLLLPLTVIPSPAATTNTSTLRPWLDYRTILWLGDRATAASATNRLFFDRLRELGINTAMVHGDGDPQPFLAAKFPFYVENMVNKGLCLKWNSQVRDWDAFVTGWVKSGRPESAFVREYCLDDPAWGDWARDTVERLARKHAPHEPVAYNLRDELSVTISANPFDYDFHPLALAGFRDWLKTQYTSLEALNAQWEAKFASWDEVRPFTTDQIKNRMASGDALPRGKPDWQAVAQVKFDPAAARQQPTRWNFSPWCDFRTYMDRSLARTLADLRDAARRVDPRTPVGIEGTQMPHAFGGYDLWRLAQAVDWVEPYDIGNAREIFGSFMPGRPVFCTVFEKATDEARRRLWHLLLEGDRGCIVWWSEDCFDWSARDFPLTAKGRALAPVLQELNSPLARLFLRAERVRDPVAIHYSQPSVQVDWLLESTVDGSTWHRRFSSFETAHNRMARVRNSWMKLLQDLGFSPRFVSSEQIESGVLLDGGFHALVLPQSLALSAREAERIRAFMFAKAPANSAEHVVFADGSPGLFDEHGKLRSRSRLEDLFPPAGSVEQSYANSPARKTVARAGDIAEYARQRAAAKPDSAWPAWAADMLGSLRPEVGVTPEARVRVHRFKLGGARLLAFERNLSWQITEDLKQAGGNTALETPVHLTAKLPRPAHAYELRTEKYLGQTDTLELTLDPWQPALFALLEERVPESGLRERLAGQTGR